MRLPVPPFPPVGTVAAPCGSPAVRHLRRYYGFVRLLAYPFLPPPVSLGGRYSALRVYSLPWDTLASLGTWFHWSRAEPIRPVRERQEALLGSREVHLKACPGLGTPATPGRPRIVGRLDAAFRQANGVGVAMTNDVGADFLTACFLAVDASSRRSPNERHHSLPARPLRL
jgi:hypothetical protein